MWEDVRVCCALSFHFVCLFCMHADFEQSLPSTRHIMSGVLAGGGFSFILDACSALSGISGVCLHHVKDHPWPWDEGLTEHVRGNEWQWDMHTYGLDVRNCFFRTAVYWFRWWFELRMRRAPGMYCLSIDERWLSKWIFVCLVDFCLAARAVVVLVVIWVVFLINSGFLRNFRRQGSISMF